VHNKEEAAGWGRAAWWCFFGRGAMLKGWHDLDQSRRGDGLALLVVAPPEYACARVPVIGVGGGRRGV
jgi:hypothetical protein